MSKKILIVLLLVLLAVLLVPVPHYNKYDADCLPCPPTDDCPPCPRKGWEFKKPILLQLIAISKPQQVSEVGETQLPQEVFSTKEECEQKTGKSCDFQMCDYIPPGKTYEEVCGEDFRKGWAAVEKIPIEKQPTSRDEPRKGTTTSTPECPVVQLRYRGQVYDGLQGSGCWPYEEAGLVHNLCWDTELPNPSDTISVSVGETLTVETKAHEKPVGLSATIFTSDGRQLVREVTLARSLLAKLKIDLPRGIYVVIIFGQWAEGDVSYGFKIKVS